VRAAASALLVLATIASLSGLACSLAGRLRRPRPWIRIGSWASYATLVTVAGATLLLLVAFLARDFSNLYVYEHSSRALSLYYTISALWAGNAGSLLLWLLLLAVFAVMAGRAARRRDPASAAYLTATLSAMTLFFSLLVLFGPRCNPFAANTVSPLPADGLGLNPMLQNPGMVVHPLALYVGYVAMAVPFALMVAGLANGDQVVAWIRPVRAWALVGWLFLTIGNVVGAWWAYVTLGWGGYWAWDPVENASLIPWLTATALLHAVSMVRRRGRHRVWMVALVSVTFLLTIFGTFLTRSGVAASVHAFEESGLIPWFSVFMLLMLALAVAVIVWRRSLLRGDASVVSPVDEASTFLYANVLLSVMTFVILWGVVFPPMVRALGGGEVLLGTEFFNVVTAPLGLLLLLLLVFCTLVRSSRRSMRRLRLDALYTGAFGLLVLVLLLALGASRGYPTAAFVLAAMVVASIALTFIRGGMGWRHRRRYGGILVHLGLVVLVVGIAGSWAYKQSTEGDVSVGESLSISDVRVTYEALQSREKPDKNESRALLALTIGGQPKGELRPSLEYYPAADQVWTRVDRRSSIGGDVYVTLLAVDAGGETVSLRVEVHPLVDWLWVGGGLMALGGILALWPARRRSGEIGDGGDPQVAGS
jgi:cytochrome c-type biogenesis protein CcmF